MSRIPVDPEAEQDFVNLIGKITNFIENERVRAFNEGLDEERARCELIVYRMKDDTPRAFDALIDKAAAAIRNGDAPIAGKGREP